MDEKQTDRLLTRIADGDNDAFVEFYEQTKRGVFFFFVFLSQQLRRRRRRYANGLS